MAVSLASTSRMAARQATQAKFARWDALFVALAIAQGVWLWARPSMALIAIGLWWNANTISHNFIHRPFFRARAWNALFSCYLSLLLGLPQTFWRERHLAHHAGLIRPIRRERLMVVEVSLVLTLWMALLVFAPAFALTVYLPGYLLGLGLCYLQGRYEHARGTISHYGRLYNLLFFNDGYHVEHHARPGEHWRQLPERMEHGACVSRWPAVLRWIESLNLCGLERLVLRSALLQQFVIKKHERAFRQLLPLLPPLERIGIVGGGLFPRTALILRRVMPEAHLALIDLSAENLQTARAFLGDEVEYVNDYFDPAAKTDFDLLVIPLALVGERAATYQHPPAPAVLVHDWLWHRRGEGAIVSWALLKRLNLVKR